MANKGFFNPSRTLRRADASTRPSTTERTDALVIDMDDSSSAPLATAVLALASLFEEAVAAPFRLRPHDYLVLRVVCERPGIPLARAAEILRFSCQRLSDHADGLEARGLLRPQFAGDRGHPRQLAPTTVGLVVAQESAEYLGSFERKIAAQFSPAESRYLLELLQRVAIPLTASSRTRSNLVSRTRARAAPMLRAAG